ncbi:MAG: class I SAM-dependent methyltransferase [Myxococcota bacterium]
MSADDEVASQKAFYDSRSHAHLHAREGDAYAGKLAGELAQRAGIGPEHRVLEVGAGFGRFTFPLLERCASVIALDLSERVLGDLRRERDARGISEERCPTLCADLSGGLRDHDLGSVDFVVGFFILHHLPDVAAALAALKPVLGQRGRMAFLEPNRRNPLYLAQVLCCRDMNWREEKGMFRLSARSIERDYRAAGLAPMPPERFGLFPPQVFNRFAAARSLERSLERARWLEPVLPFLVLRAHLVDA